MKRFLALAYSLLLNLPAQEAAPVPREDLIATLMEARNAEAFNSAYLAAAGAGLPQQTLIEARFLYLVDQGSQSDLAAYAPVLQKQLPDFRIDDSMIFAIREDFESIIQYTLALAALEKKDYVLFKKHITEAFWLSPEQAGQFGPLINEVRLVRAMENVTLDLGERFENQKEAGSQKSLKEIMGDSKAILLHFWSPWARPSLESMSDYHTTAKELIEHGIPAVSLLLSGAEDSRIEADRFLGAAGEEAVGHWLVDHAQQSLATRLRVSAFPIVALISDEGKVLFNGNPGDPVLWTKLRKIGPAISQPMASPILPELESLEDEPSQDEEQK